MKEEIYEGTYIVEVIFNKPVKLPYDDDIKEDICYMGVLDHEIISTGHTSFLVIKFEESTIYLNQENISAVQVNIDNFEDLNNDTEEKETPEKGDLN